jgi:hypothetical protein
MFRCELCQRVAQPGVRAQKIAVRRRTKQYPYRIEANRFYRTNENHKRKLKTTDDPGGAGMETVLEVSVCPTCAANNQRLELGPKRTG